MFVDDSYCYKGKVVGVLSARGDMGMKKFPTQGISRKNKGKE
jgi:hypothetical protein